MSDRTMENMKQARRDRLRAALGREPTDQEVQDDFDSAWRRAVEMSGTGVAFLPATKVTV